MPDDSEFGPDPELNVPARRYDDVILPNPETESEKLARALRESKPSWQTDGQGVRGPQQPRNPEAERRTEFPIGSVQREPRQPFFPEDPVIATTAGGTGVANPFPFQVTPVGGGSTAVKIYPGKVENVMARIDLDIPAQQLDADPPPTLSLAFGVSDIVMKVTIGTEDSDLYRYKIISAIISAVPTNAPPTDPPQPDEFVMRWDNDLTRDAGYFLVNIARCNVTFANDTTSIGIIQYLFGSLLALAFIGMRVLIINSGPIRV